MYDLDVSTIHIPFKIDDKSGLICERRTRNMDKIDLITDSFPRSVIYIKLAILTTKSHYGRNQNDNS